MHVLQFAGIPHYINVIMEDSEYYVFSDFVLSINQVHDLPLYEIANWIGTHLPTCYRFLEWYDKTDTKGWYYPKNKIIIDIVHGVDYSRVIISGLVMKPAFPRSDFGTEMDEINTYWLLRRQKMRVEIPTTPLHIKDVIFNNPATIVFWSDGTKTVCMCSKEDTYDPEKGLALCCMKKLLYKNKGHIFNNAREKWLKKS